MPTCQVVLLVRYNIVTSEATLKQLEDAPLSWKALQKKMQARYASEAAYDCAGRAVWRAAQVRC